MNALAKTLQNNNLRFSPGLFLPGLKIDKLDGIQVDRQKRVVDRSGQFSHKPGFIPQQFVERTQEPDIVDCKICASSFRHDSYRLRTGVPATQRGLRAIREIYT